VLCVLLAIKLRDDSQTAGSAQALSSSDGRPGENAPAAGRSARSTNQSQVEADDYRSDLARIQQELWRLESLLFTSASAYVPANDPLRQVEARLRVLESEIGALESHLKTSQP
jgi:hypothetical protein